MKKYFALIMAVLLTAVLFTGCSKPDASLVGTWQGQLPLASVIGVQEQSSLNLYITLSFFEDSTFALTVDTSEITEKLDEIAQKAGEAGQGAKSGIEQLLKALGVENEMLSQAMKWLFPEKSADDEEAAKSTVIKGRFKTEDGKLYLSFVKAVGIYGSSYLTYSVEADTLTLDSFTGEQAELTQMVSPLLPITFQKVQ